VPGGHEPVGLLAALGPGMPRLAGELADGTLIWLAVPSLGWWRPCRCALPPTSNIGRLADVGVTAFIAAPVGAPEEQQRTLKALAEGYAPAR
jgi:hypothetical protein